jgi:diguanylate cyclase (GGDEF)-like protein
MIASGSGALLLAVSASAAFALAAFAAFGARRARRPAPLEMRLLEGRQREIHRGLRACLAAARSSPHDVHKRFAHAARELDPAIDGVICFERSGPVLRCTFADGPEAALIRETVLPIETEGAPPVAAFLHGHRIDSGAPLLPTDRSFLAIPLSDGTQAFGAWYCTSRQAGAFAGEPAIVALAELAGPLLALARERARDREHASLDALTGLLTPRTFRDRLVELNLRAGMRYALAFIDSDNFKACNDALGHAAGDAVLKELAVVFSSSAGHDALVARNGGDEFCVLFAGLTKFDAIRRAEALREAVEAHAFEPALAGRTPARPITASIGVASFPEDADSGAALLERADAAMYHSKRAGRNCVSFYALDGAVAQVSPRRISARSATVLPEGSIAR